MAIYVDLDGTLAHYDGWKGPDHIGEPIPEMVERVKAWTAKGEVVKIFTARAWLRDTLMIQGDKEGATRELEQTLGPIMDWCYKHLGMMFEITSRKGFDMVEMWDDRAVQVIMNTGLPVLAGEVRNAN